MANDPVVGPNQYALQSQGKIFEEGEDIQRQLRSIPINRSQSVSNLKNFKYNFDTNNSGQNTVAQRSQNSYFKEEQHWATSQIANISNRRSGHEEIMQKHFMSVPKEKYDSFKLDNIFRHQKNLLKSNGSVYSSNRNYLELLANEKSINFNPSDLKRIQQKARSLHWLSAIDDNPYPIRPKEFHIKELPKNGKDNQVEGQQTQMSPLDQSYLYAQMAIQQFQHNLTKIEKYNLKYPAKIHKQQDEDDNNYLEKPEEIKKQADQKVMKDYLQKIKCIDPEKMKIFKKKIQRDQPYDQQDNQVQRSVSLPHLRITSREDQILNRVRENIEHINMDNQSVIGFNQMAGLGDSVLSSTIQQTQTVLREAIDQSNLQRQKDLERKNFLMNVITDNQLFDQKIQQEHKKGKGKIMQEQLKHIYQSHNKEALNEVQKIRSDMLLQAFKKKIEKEVKDPKKLISPQSLADNHPINFQDTASNINLIERAKNLLDRSEVDISPTKSTRLKKSFMKKQVYLSKDEGDLDPQFEDVNKYHILPADVIQDLNSSKVGGEVRSKNSSSVIFQTFKKTQEEKIHDLLTETKDKISKLKKENIEMKKISQYQVNGEQKYTKQFRRLNKSVFKLVKDNETQELYRLLKIHGEEFANAIDKLGETPLHWAVKRCFTECVEILLNFGANPLTEDSFQRTPYSLVDKNHNVQIERMLKLAIQGKFESTAGKFEARELILKEPSKKKVQ